MLRYQTLYRLEQRKRMYFEKRSDMIRAYLYLHWTGVLIQHCNTQNIRLDIILHAPLPIAFNPWNPRLGYTTLKGLELQSTTKYIEADGNTANCAQPTACDRACERAQLSPLTCVSPFIYQRAPLTPEKKFSTLLNFYNFHPIFELYGEKM